MSKKSNFIGKRFGRLLIESEDKPHIYPSGRPRRKFICLCDCGNKVSVMINLLKSGNTKSCGCYKLELITNLKYSHGLRYHPLHDRWSNIKNRCYNPNTQFYANYGGKGIRVCDEWRNSFQSFYDWCIKNGWKENLSIERKDINKGYEPSNCCFISMKEQANNRTNTVWITICGERKNATQWCNYLGLKNTTVLNKIRKGVNPMEALGIW